VLLYLGVSMVILTRVELFPGTKDEVIEVVE
jgi:hypothetical protein